MNTQFEDSPLEAENIPYKAYFNDDELQHLTRQFDQLKQYLEAKDYEKALTCIQELIQVNDQGFYRIIGKLARGLHSAISDLNLSSLPSDQDVKNPTRVDLDYVMKVTGEAAIKTLDMTEKSRNSLTDLTDMYTQQRQLLEEYQTGPKTDEDLSRLMGKLNGICDDGQEISRELNNNITEIILAQNFQDLTSQSISKAITIINEVENSLISLVHYTNLLKKLSRFTEENETIEPEDSEAIQSDIDQMGKISDSEHLNQNDVDDLLSSLGF